MKYYRYLLAHSVLMLAEVVSQSLPGGVLLDNNMVSLMQLTPGNIAKLAATSKIASDKALKAVSALVVEPRCHPALPLVVWNMQRQLPDLPIQLFYSADNKEAVELWFDHMPAVTLTPLPGSFYNYFDHDSYSRLFTDASFWGQVNGDKVLNFHQDTWVCGGNAEQKLEGFLKFDYIGAPWAHAVGQAEGCNGVGNGGFSLRTVSVMRELTAKFGSHKDPPEDVYFCEHLAHWASATMPDAKTADDFAFEETNFDHPKEGPLGTHRPWTYSWFQGDTQFREHCPGLDLLASAQAGAQLECNAAVAQGLENVAQAEREFNASTSLLQIGAGADHNAGGKLQVPFAVSLVRNLTSPKV